MSDVTVWTRPLRPEQLAARIALDSLDESTAADSADLLLIYDDSESENRYQTRETLLGAYLGLLEASMAGTATAGLELQVGDADGDSIRITLMGSSAGSHLEVYGDSASAVVFDVDSAGAVTVSQHVDLAEQSSIGTPAAGYGRFAIQDDDPTTAHFVDDGGTDHQLVTGGDALADIGRIAIVSGSGDLGQSDLAASSYDLWTDTGDIDGAVLRLQYVGYDGGTTRYRDLAIYDGKQNLMLFIDGSEAKTTLSCDAEIEGALLVDGGTDPGSVASDEVSAAAGTLRVGSSAYIDEMAIYDARIETPTADDDSAEIAINNLGYDGGTTRYRDFAIYDGKQNLMFFVDGSENEITSWSDMAIEGDLAISSGGTLSVGVSAKIDGIKIYDTIIDAPTTDSDSAAVAINYNGYDGGTTRYRDFAIYDGKQNLMLFIDGSEAKTTLSCDAEIEGALLVDGGTDPGSVASDEVSAAGGTLRVGSSAYIDDIRIYDSIIETPTTDSDTAAVAINYNGYAGGTTRYRDFAVYDGKQGGLFECIGLTGAVGTKLSKAKATVADMRAGNIGAMDSNGMRFLSFSDGNNIFDSKVGNGSVTSFRTAHNTEDVNSGRVWLSVVGSSGKATFNYALNFSGLPTSSSGLSSGDVWSDGGTLKIV